MRLRRYIRRLEHLSQRCGVPVVRIALHAQVMGRVEARRLVLRTGLTPEQQLLTLAHELTHLLVHCGSQPKIDRTICEYEAEAVEQWVGIVLRVPPYAEDTLTLDTVTDGLLDCSVKRVRRTARVLLNAALSSSGAECSLAD